MKFSSLFHANLAVPGFKFKCVELLVSFGFYLSAKVIGLFGTNKVSAFSTAMTAFALLGFSVPANFFSLCLFALPLGRRFCISIGTVCYDSVRQGATFMLRQMMCPPSLTERPMPPFR